MPGEPTNAGYAQTTLASGKGEGFVQPEFLGPLRKAAATRTRNRARVSLFLKLSPTIGPPPCIR